MPDALTRDGVRLHWIREGEGPAVLLVHGFGSDIERNWRNPRWITTLVEAGFEVLAFDQRGHGRSEKLHDPSAYAADRLAGDPLAVLDAAGIRTAALLGYSMGSITVLSAALLAPERAWALTIGGTGAAFPNFPTLGATTDRDLEVVARVLETEDPEPFPAWARGYREFAERGGQDLRALAACWRRDRKTFDADELRAITMPALVVTGTEDETSGDGAPLAAALGNARHVALEGADHMRAVGDRRHREAVVDFLTSSRPDPTLRAPRSRR